MGKGNFLLKSVTGNIGDISFYRSKGEQRIRARVAAENPRTMAQQSQRARVAAVAAAYRAGRGVLADSLQPQSPLLSGYNEFMKAAMPTAPFMTKDAADLGGSIPFPMMLAKGNLPQPYEYFAKSDNLLKYFIGPLDGVPSTNYKWGDISKGLIKYKPCVYKNGTRIHFVEMVWVAQLVAGVTVYQPNFHHEELYVDTTSTGTPWADLTYWGLSMVNNSMVVERDLDGEYLCSGIFISNYDDANGLMVSTCIGTLSDEADLIYQDYISEAARIAAAESYGGDNARCVL